MQMPGYNVQYTLCQWADAVKNIPSTLKTWRKPVWQEDGDSVQDSTLADSEMPGELREYKNAQHEKAMKAPIKMYEELDEKLRKKGLI